jgi:hypothetical protein
MLNLAGLSTYRETDKEDERFNSIPVLDFKTGRVYTEVL